MKRAIALLLVLVMMLTLMPMSVFAEAAEPVFSVESTWAQPGHKVDVNILVENNPGIVTTKLNVAFPEELTLVGYSEGKAFSELKITAPAELSRGGAVTGSANFTWLTSELEDEAQDGIILTLSFEVAETAALNKKYPIVLTAGTTGINDGSKVDVSTENGDITTIDYTPGDVDESGTIDMIDILTLCQYIVDDCKYNEKGYAIRLRDAAANVDRDDEIGMLDVLCICRYIVDDCKTNPDGYNIKLYPSNIACKHNLEAVEAKDATCTEDGNIAYWHCTECDNYYSDAEGKTAISLEDTIIAAGHDLVEDEGTPATTSSVGYTAGVYCNRCQKWISGHEEYGPLETKEANISYFMTYVKETKDGITEIHTDQYLKQLDIDNSANPKTYVEGEGTGILAEPEVGGYSFLGWYELPEAGAKRVYSISADSTGDKVIYGVWKKEPNTVTYLPDSAGSTLQKIKEETYYSDRDTALQVPTWENLVWIGWSDDDGNIVKSIPKGTSGNISLTANWMSRRNQTVPKKDYASTVPAICADEENGIYAFTYEIGDIQNVPIQAIDDGADGKGFNLVKGETKEIEKTFTQNTTEGEATNVANVIANATVKSDAWTLSEDWNQSTSFSEEHASEVSQEQAFKAAKSFTDSKKYAISSGQGRTKEHIDENGTSTKTTKKNEVGVSLNVGVAADLNPKGSILKKLDNVKGAKATGNFGVDYKHSKETTSEKHETHTDKVSTTWNTNKSMERSKSLSGSQEFAQSLSQSIKDTYSYGQTLDFGGSKSNTVSSSNTSSESREYSSSVTYSTEIGNKVSVKETLTANAETGYYRKVLTANFRVFAVVIYDVKSSTFSTMTYSLKIKDSEHLFTDYSTVSSFNDYENGVLPFAVPQYVSDYIYTVVGKSDGLRINDETGAVEGYGYKDPATGICYKHYDDSTNTYSDPCDTDVVIPQYIVVNVSATQKRIVPVTGISASAFQGTNITSIYLNDGITEIPANAFKDCTSLNYVTGGKVSSIGESAFENCTSLCEQALSENVTYLGNNAFKGDKSLSITAASPAIVDAAMNSGAKELYISLEKMNGSIDGKQLKTPDSMTLFSLDGGGKSYKNVNIESDADTVEIINITLNSSSGIPLKLSSENLNLSFANISASGLVMDLRADTTKITVDGNNYISSSTGIASLSKSLKILEKSDSSSIGKLRLTGDAYVYGTVSGSNNMSFENASYRVVTLTKEEYENYINRITVSFDPNGGTLPEGSGSKQVFFGTAVGELPEPTRAHYTFAGWFTDAEGGELVDADTPISTIGGVTLYAHWNATAYTATWAASTGTTITVSRTSSPNANAETGTLKSGEPIYYGDVLSIKYAAKTGYTLSENGKTSITVTGNVTKVDIYANANPKDYTYKVVYKSSNGTELGSDKVKKAFGTTNTITAPAKAGYVTPDPQSVKWDSTTAKTITFTYGITPQSTSRQAANGWWWHENSYGISYNAYVEYQNRTASSVQIRIKWVQTIQNCFYGYNQWFYASCGGQNTGSVKITAASTWASVNHNESRTVYSNWMTVPVSATATSVGVACDWWTDGPSHNGSWGFEMPIPTY